MLLDAKSVDKKFNGVYALKGLDFSLGEGEVHGLIGENGAGKSTFIKILGGVYKRDGGSILWNGKDLPEVIRPEESRKLGINIIFQDNVLIPAFTGMENICLGRPYPVKGGLIQWKEMEREAAAKAAELGIHLDLKRPVSMMTPAQKKCVEIVRAMMSDCKLLILDEPTSSLDEEEVEKLFGLMKKLKAKGVGIIFVTHFLEQVYEVCDKITVLRNGTLVGEYDVENLPRVQLVAKMMGKDFDDLADIKSDRVGSVKEGEPVIEANGVSHHGSIKPFDMTFNKGEVVGLTGLLGSGRSEMVRAIYGADKADTGEVKVFGKKVKINTPLDAMKAGMAYLPEDRKKDGILADLSVRENIIIALQAKRGMFHPMKRKEMEDAATNFINLLQIKTASMETPIKSLSGGNQQKVILGRWLLTNPRFLILDEPTRGIDIGTKTEIQKLVLRLADEGKSIAFISSEVEEMLRTCSRMAVLRDGKKVGEIEGDDLTQEKIMETIAGGGKSNE